MMDENVIWSNDQNFILQVFTQESHKWFKKDPNNNVRLAVSLSKDISKKDI